MALPFSEVKSIIDNQIDKDIITCIEELIDGKLSSKRWLNDWRRGTPEEGYWYMIVYPGELNRAEKELLVKKYLEAGYQSVEVKNSSEDGERPGMIGITIRFPPKL